ncbi:MAG TPA: hypothetical protein VK846_09800 [Candidatus Limnocylindria bacterium]|nr:hypothetical protein [Candidatus Limnocylindria bacterium]
MKRFISAGLILILSLTFVIATSQGAEDKAKADTGSVEAAWKRRVPDFQAELGRRDENFSLSEFVKARLAPAFPEINFIIPENLRDADVPYFQLRNVTLSDILKALELSTAGRIRGGVPADALVDATGLPVPRLAAESNLVTFTILSAPGTAPSVQTTVMCRVFSLTSYLEHRSATESDRAMNLLYETFAVAWEMLSKQDGDVRQPSLKIHQGTKLLIAVGREKELVVIEQVIKELQGSAPTRTVAAPADNELKPKSTTASPPPAAGTKP